MFYLARTPIPDADNPGEKRWVEVWDHVSSRDLLRWVHHPVALEPALDGSTPHGIWSGDAIEGAPLPTLIYHVPGQGACVAQSTDPDLNHWVPFAENPVIPLNGEQDEYISFDTGGWYRDGIYYLLVGNKSGTAGYGEGDGTSLFTSRDLKQWEYQGPFYKSRREWTGSEQDCACPDFFPFGDGHMLLMHGHQPVFHVHYYLGEFRSPRFEPCMHGAMSGPGGCLAAPETWIDVRGRRIMIGWLRPPGRLFRVWQENGWASAMSLPRVLEPDPVHGLRMFPVPELRTLRGKTLSSPSRMLDDGKVHTLSGIRGRVLEIEAVFMPGDAKQLGLEVLCSGDNSERTVLEVDVEREVLRGRFDQSGPVDVEGMKPLDPGQKGVHELPFRLEEEESLHLQVFVDRSIVEVFANQRQCLVIHVFPSLEDSDQVRCFARGGCAELKELSAWPLDRVNPW